MLDNVSEPEFSSTVFDFTVSRHPIFKKDGAPVVGYQVLSRDDTSDDLAVVRDSYAVVQNNELFSQAMQEIESGIGHSAGKPVISDRVAYKGGICIRDVIFPETKFPVNDHDTAMRLILMNAFGRGAIKIYFGAIEFFCTNGMIRGQYDHVYKKHTSGLTIEGIGRTMRRALGTFERDVQEWNAWAGKSITRTTASETLTKLGMSRMLALKLSAQFDHEVKQRGSTVWALYSALTYYATHSDAGFPIRETGADHGAMTLVKREEQVMRWTNHDAWKALTATAA